jgi:molecular chaperone GrpE
MYKRVRVPIRVRPSGVPRQPSIADGPAVAKSVPPVREHDPAAAAGRLSERSRPGPVAAPACPEAQPARPEIESGSPRSEPDTQHATRNTEHVTRNTQDARGQDPERDSQVIEEEESLDLWRDRALRLQAEIENFRKRQQRLAEARILADRERLLRAFLRVADDLERALNADGADADDLRQGVDLTYRSLMRLLDQEGAEPIEAAGQPFDPAWHEAVGTVPHVRAGAEPDTVVKVVEAGYRLGDRLLRPARVIVAA